MHLYIQAHTHTNNSGSVSSTHPFGLVVRWLQGGLCLSSPSSFIFGAGKLVAIEGSIPSSAFVRNSMSVCAYKLIWCTLWRYTVHMYVFLPGYPVTQQPLLPGSIEQYLCMLPHSNTYQPWAGVVTMRIVCSVQQNIGFAKNLYATSQQIQSAQHQGFCWKLGCGGGAVHHCAQCGTEGPLPHTVWAHWVPYYFLHLCYAVCCGREGVSVFENIGFAKNL